MRNTEKERMSYIRTPEIRKKNSISMKGRKFSQKHRKAMSIALKGVKKNRPIGSMKPQTKEHRKKISLAHLGSKSHFWKGGVSKESEIIRASCEYTYWRKQCFIRDNYTCQKCNKSGGKLVVHHINNFAEFPELRTVVENGITLCWLCHLNFHNKYKRVNNTMEQLLEFLLTSND